MSKRCCAFVCAVVSVVALSSLSFAVTPDRIGAIDSSAMVELKGHVPAMARPQFDKGPVDPTKKLQVTMLLMPTAQQDQSLRQLLADQQDPKSPLFHKWLTVPEYADRFALSQADISKIKSWLQNQGFKVSYVANGRDFITFEGSAALVQSTFRTEIHSYSVNGKMHFANATAPMIPAVLSGVVGGFRGMHDFTPHPMIRKHPDYSIPASGGGFFTFLAPGDVATIYDLNALYQANPAIDGTGQSVVVAGQSDVYLADLNDFRSAFFPNRAQFNCTTDTNGLITSCASGSSLQFVVPGNTTNPGAVAGDLGESDLDIEWISSVAPGAQVIFVTSPASIGGVDKSTAWATDQNPPLAPVISYSYGLCEAFVTAPFIPPAETEYKKAASLGISFFAASGDAGATTCDGDNGTYPAILGQSVSYPASSAYVTGVGGTEFDEGAGTYWSSTNTNNASALSYIPETAWNDTAQSVAAGFGPAATGGGPSNCANGTGTTTVSGFSFEICNTPPNGGFPKPSWQSGGITPNDGVRDVPDISFSGSNANDPYIVCVPQSEVVTNSTSKTSTCVNGISTALTTYNSAFGGTSASTPVAAAMTVLLNQSLGTNGLGNMNPQLYSIYQAHPSVFHNIVSGTNATTGGTSDNFISCTSGTPSFEPGALQCTGSDKIGYTAGTGYNTVTGLGSIDINALLLEWPSSRGASTTTLAASASQINPGDSITFTATVAPTSGVGSVKFSTLNQGVTTVLGTALVNLPYPQTTTGTAVFTTTALPGGANSVTASYLGDAVNGSSTSTPSVVNVADFSLSSSPAAATVVAGHNSGPIAVTITPLFGYNQATTLSCTGQSGGAMPTGVSCTFSPNPMSAGTNSTTMTIATNASMATGAAPVFNIKATNGGSVTHTSSFTLTVGATDQSFTIAPGATTYSVTQGGSVSGSNATITLTGTNEFSTTNSPVTYTCSDPASESTCTMTANSTGATFVISTTPPSAARLSVPGHGMRVFYAAMMPGLLGIVFLAGSRKRSVRGVRLLGLIVVLGVSTMWTTSCGGTNGGGNSNPGTPKGTYTITVNATTGGTHALTAQTTFTLTVQ